MTNILLWCLHNWFVRQFCFSTNTTAITVLVATPFLLPPPPFYFHIFKEHFYRALSSTRAFVSENSAVYVSLFQSTHSPAWFDRKIWRLGFLQKVWLCTLDNICFTVLQWKYLLCRAESSMIVHKCTCRKFLKTVRYASKNANKNQGYKKTCILV